MSKFKFNDQERNDIRIDMNSQILTDGEIIDRIESIISARGLLIAEHGEIQPTPSIPIHGDSVASTSTIHGLEAELPDPCPICGGKMVIVRPGKWQCDFCDY